MLAGSEKNKILNDYSYLEKIYNDLELTRKETKMKLNDSENKNNNIRKEKAELEREFMQSKVKSDQQTEDIKNLKNDISCLETQVTSLNHSHSILKQENENQYKRHCGLLEEEKEKLYHTSKKFDLLQQEYTRT